MIFVTGPNGRRVRKPLEGAINDKLVETAAKGDFKAIKVIPRTVQHAFANQFGKAPGAGRHGGHELRSCLA